jgi:hypothetical protein
MRKNDMARFTAVNKLCSVYQWLREKPTLRFVVLGGVVVFVLMVVGIIIAFLGQQFSSPDAESPWVSNSPLSGEELYSRLIRAMVMIGYGPVEGIRFGFIVDTDQPKIITRSGFLDDTVKRVNLAFPRYNPAGELNIDLGPYMVDIVSGRYPGELLAVDRQWDMALIQVEKLPQQAAALPLAKHPAKTGSVVYSMSPLHPTTNNKQLWQLTKQNVLDRRRVRFGDVDVMMLETDNPLQIDYDISTYNPLVNDRCQVVGIGTRNQYLDVEVVRHFLRTHSTRRFEPPPVRHFPRTHSTKR